MYSKKGKLIGQILLIYPDKVIFPDVSHNRKSERIVEGISKGVIAKVEGITSDVKGVS